MLRAQVETIVREVLLERWSDEAIAPVRVEPSRGKKHGDFAVNAAMVLARRENRPPRAIASEIAAVLEKNALFDGVDVAGPGFLNLRLGTSAFHRLLAHILERGEAYGTTPATHPSRQQIEFVSANPTGPLNIVSARAAAVGDTLAHLFEATGVQVEREFYVNDHGSQVQHLADSILWHREEGEGPFPEEGYRGSYVEDLAAASREALDPLFPIDEKGAGPEAVEPFLLPLGPLAAGEEGPLVEALGAAGGAPLPVTSDAFRSLLCAWAVEKMLLSQREQLRAFAVRYDRWFRESELYGAGRIEKALAKMDETGDVCEREGARWFRSTRYGDDEDRVIVRSSGEPTYLLADIAYHQEKIERGYDHVIDILGPDHHGHIPRMIGAIQSLGREKDWLEILIVQQVNLLRGGKVVKMSKRAGEFITLDDLVREVGKDASRFFFVMLRPNSHLNFDLDLAKSKSLDNPVYYVQYAHARICSVFAHARAAGIDPERLEGAPLERLVHEGEIDLLRTLDVYPDVVAMAAATREPHRIPVYLKDLAGRFHAYYHKAKVVGDDEELTVARLALLHGIRVVLRGGLALLGVGAPETM